MLMKSLLLALLIFVVYLLSMNGKASNTPLI